MLLYDQYALPRKICKAKKLSCYLALEEIFFGLDLNTGMFQAMSQEGSKNIAGNNKYYKITYNEAKKHYYCTCCQNSKWAQLIFVLDESFQEIDSIAYCIDSNGAFIHDLYYDAYKNIFYAVTPRKIAKLTLNGDNLGILMCASNSRNYLALCTFHDTIFILYEEKNGLFLASYTESGSFIEKIPLSSEYLICNMQVVKKKKHYCISIFVYKNKRYPYILEIMLEGKPKKTIEYENLQIEAEERNDINITCNLDI